MWDDDRPRPTNPADGTAGTPTNSTPRDLPDTPATTPPPGSVMGAPPTGQQATRPWQNLAAYDEPDEAPMQREGLDEATVQRQDPDETPTYGQGPDEPAAGAGDSTDAGAAGEPAGTRPARPSRPRFRDRRPGWWLAPGAAAATPSTRPAATTSGSQVPAAGAPNAGAPTTGPGAESPVTAGAGRPLPRAALAAAAVGLLIIGFGIGRLFSGSASTGAPAIPPTATAAPLAFTPLQGPPLSVSAVLGAGDGLSAPRDAAHLSGGRIGVADTANGRLVVLGPSGQPLRAFPHGYGGLIQPYSVVAAGGGFDVLDAMRDAIVRFDRNGRPVRQLAQGVALHLGRGLAVGPDGTLYVANPLSNSIVVLGPDGRILRAIHTTNGSAPGQFDQVSDVAAGPRGIIYVLDNQNNRIEELSDNGAFMAEWPAPPSSTIYSVHILPLGGGRLLATDPGGALLYYLPGGGSPTRSTLTLGGQPLTHVQPTGLQLLRPGKVLVVDSTGNRVLVVDVPQATP